MTSALGSVHTMASLIDTIPGVYQPQNDLETTVSALAIKTVVSASVILVILTILALINKKDRFKLPLFVLMAVTMAGSTLTLIGSTVYLNSLASSGGPVHWHADFEIWACDNQLELRDPSGFLSNKIGTSTLHEHDDERIHLEGVVVDDEIDATLGKFFNVVGGAITTEQLVVPLNDAPASIFEDKVDGDGPAVTNPAAIDSYVVNDSDLGRVAHLRDGDTCGDQSADVQVYVYQYDASSKTYQQSKINNPRDYVLTKDSNVPDGDCIIFEFGPTSDTTNKLCEQYGIRDINRCEAFGVALSQRKICDIQETTNGPVNLDRGGGNF